MKKKKILFAIIAFIIIEGASILNIENSHNKEMTQYLDKQTKELEVKQKSVQNTYGLMVDNIFHQTINKPELLQLFSKAYNADSLQKTVIRDSLYNLLNPTYIYLRSSNIKQLHFHLPNNESFLRFHRPEKFGDNLTEYRYSVRMTNLNKKPYSGFEEGKIYNGFRNVFPLFYDSIHIGSVETSFSFEAINTQLQQHEENIYGFMLKKDIIGEKVFESEKNNYIPSLISDKYMHEKAFIHYKYDSLNILKELDKVISSEAKTKISNNENFTIFKKINGDYWLTSFVSVNNVEGLPVAYIFSYKKDSIIPEYIKQYKTVHIASFSTYFILILFILLFNLKRAKIKEIDDDYRKILDANNDIVFMINAFGRLLYFNKQVEIFLGHKPEDVIGKSFKEFVLKNEIPLHLSKLKEAFLNKQISPYETFALHKDGRHIPVEIAGKIIKYKGKIVGVGTIRDITKRKKAKQALLESENRYKEVEKIAQLGHWEIDIPNNKLFWSDEIHRIFDIKKEQFKGTYEAFIENIHPEDKERVNKAYKSSLKTKEPYEIEHRILLKNGKIKYVKEKCRTTFDDTGNPLLSIGMVHDITDRKKAEQSLKDSEEKFRRIFNSISDSIFIHKFGKGFIELNKSAHEKLGYTKDEILQMPSSKPIINGNTEDIKNRIIKVQKKGFLKFEIEYIHKNGTKIPFEVNSILTEYNKENVILSIARDITERKKAEQDILKNEAKYRAVFNTSMSGISIIDKNGINIDTNPASEKIHGFTKEEVVGVNFNKHMYPDDIPKAKQLLINVLTGKDEFVSAELRLINKHTKKPVWIFLNGTKYPHISSDFKNTVIVAFQDISYLKKIEEELNNAKLDAEKANRLKSEFLANMSHEIRTPMNAIIGFSSILQNKLKDKKERSFIDKIAKSGNNLLELINDILDLSKIEAGQLKIQKTKTRTQDIFNEIPQIFSEQSKYNQIPINLNIHNNVPKLLVVDALRIRQVLLNLVSNALKFTDDGSISIIVTQTTNKNQDHNSNENLIDLQIQVKDTGIGIPENQLDLVFQNFRQIEGQNTRKYGGTGLGLAITKRLLKLMNGTIKVESSLGIGSIFTIDLKDVEIVDSEQEEIKKENNLDLSFHKSKILHVEDIDYNREIISLYLDNENIELKEARTGKQALEMLKTYKPDIILMDIQLPGQSGYEITKIIKQTKGIMHIPVIAVTANATDDDISKYSHIFDEYLTKPIIESTLLKTIAKYLKLK